jgi:invasion protein IalB
VRRANRANVAAVCHGSQHVGLQRRFRPGMKLIGEVDHTNVAANYSNCVPADCFAVTELDDDVIRKLRVLTTNGRLQFKDAADREIAVPVSFKGFSEAYALTK